VRGDRVEKVGLIKEVVSQEALVKRHWKDFIEGLLDARRAWEKFQGVRLEMPSLDMLEIEWQEVMTKVPYMSRFELALDSLMSYWQMQGGTEILLPPEKEKTKKEESD